MKKKKKKSNTLIIIIIVTAITLTIIITIFIIFLIRKLSRKKKIYNAKENDFVAKYGLSEKQEKHKRSIKNKNKSYSTTIQTIQTIETNSHKRSIKNRKDTDKPPSKISKDDISFYKKDK